MAELKELNALERAKWLEFALGLPKGTSQAMNSLYQQTSIILACRGQELSTEACEHLASSLTGRELDDLAKEAMTLNGMGKEAQEDLEKNLEPSLSVVSSSD
jgi:hypothetical protein